MSDEQIYDSDPNEDTSWLVTYGDMVTLLMAFFVLMPPLRKSVKKSMSKWRKA